MSLLKSWTGLNIRSTDMCINLFSLKYSIAVKEIKLTYTSKYPINITWENKPSECLYDPLDYKCTGMNGFDSLQFLDGFIVILVSDLY